MSSIIAVEPNGEAGALVYWSLAGNVLLEDLAETLLAEGLDESFLPEAPSKDIALRRAAQEASIGKRQLVRPLGGKRQGYVVVSERPATDGTRQLEHQEHVVCTVTRKENEPPVYNVKPVLQEDLPMALQILQLAEDAEGTLTPNDMSSWLLRLLWSHVRAVSLRERGGFYFVPHDRMNTWREVVRIVEACSQHKLFEIPAMRTEKAVEAILTAVRDEAQDELRRMEEYLTGPEVSTRGLNAWERRMSELQGKLAHYAQLLGTALPDVDTKAERLLGALQAARLMKDNPEPARAAE